MLRVVAVIVTALEVAAQSQARRFAPTTDFEPGAPWVMTGAVAYEPVSGFAYYAGTTASSTSAAELWRHVDGTWQLVATATALPPFPSSTRAAACAWPGHGMLLVANAQTWLFDGTDWQHLAIAAPTPMRTIEFDAARHRIVGLREGSPVQVHEFDGSTWMPIATAPPPVSNGRLAWHAGLQRVVMVGTNGTAHAFCSWDGSAWTTHFWVLGSPNGFSLAPAPGGSVLICGGWNFTYDYGESRVWNGSTTTPTHIGNLPNAPPFRATSVSWFDPIRNHTVVTSFADNWTTWTWNGTAWAVSGAGLQPPSLDPVVYDSWRGRMLMAGGHSAPSVEHADLWSRRDTTWQRIGTGPFLPVRFANAAFDSWRGELVLFGGAVHDSGAGAWYSAPTQDTWVWNGETWALRGIGPSPRSHAAIAFDRTRGRVVVFGGQTQWSGLFVQRNDTWEWDGVAWQQRFPLTVPTTAPEPTMAFEQASGQCVLCSGTSLWRWNGNDWTAAGPAPGGALVEDPARGLLLLIGNGVHELHGTTWVQTTTRTCTGRGAFDLGRGMVVAGDLAGTFEYGDSAAATLQPFGLGCSGTAGVPVLHGDVPPRLGAVLPLRVERLPANAIALGVLGDDADSWFGISLPVDLTPIGMPLCELRTGIDAAATITADWSIPVPAASPLLGARCRVQAVVLDAAANAFGATTSNAVRLRIGS